MTNKILRVFPRKTSFTPNDDMAFIGYPGLFLPPADEVHVSVVFTWDIPEGRRLQSAWAQYYPVVKIGGPAFGDSSGSFVPGRYIKAGVTFTTRGCNNCCPWCMVPEKEGKLTQIINFHNGWIIQDNNLLQASRHHIGRVFTMLQNQKHAALFSGGLQASLVDDWLVEQLRTIHLESVFLAADTFGALGALEKALNKLTEFGRRKLRVYCMVGRNETIKSAHYRLQTIWDMGGLPFAQLYQPADKYIQYGPDWKSLVREWSRPAIMYSTQNATNTSEQLALM
jgi:hypothetical protein